MNKEFIHWVKNEYDKPPARKWWNDKEFKVYRRLWGSKVLVITENGKWIEIS